MRKDHRVDETDPAREPAGSQKGHSRKDVDEEEEDRELFRVKSPAHEEPVRDERLHDEPSRERIDSEERTELRDRSGGAMDSEEAPLAFDACRLHFLREAEKDHQVEETDEGIKDEEGTIGIRPHEAERGEGRDRPGEK